MRGGFKPNMLTCVSHERDRQQCPEDRIADPQINRHWPKAVSRGEIAGEERCDAYGEVAGEFVEADGKAARLWPDQIDLHEHRHRPGKPLIDAEQRIGCDDPSPTRSPHDHEGDGQPDQPAEDENMLPAPRIGELP